MLVLVLGAQDCQLLLQEHDLHRRAVVVPDLLLVEQSIVSVVSPGCPQMRSI